MDVRSCLWFDGRIEEAARFSVSLVPGSRLGAVTRSPGDNPFPSGEPGEALTVDFSLGGVPYQLLDGGPQFRSLRRCRWCKDRFGLSWQVVPSRFVELMAGPSASAVSAALMGMRRIDIAALEAAAAG